KVFVGYVTALLSRLQPIPAHFAAPAQGLRPRPSDEVSARYPRHGSTPCPARSVRARPAREPESALDDLARQCLVAREHRPFPEGTFAGLLPPQTGSARCVALQSRPAGRQ